MNNNTNHTPEEYNQADQIKLLHALQVYQIELKMQQEELQLAKEKAEVVAKKYSSLYDFAPFGYFTLNAAGDISELNLNGANMLNKSRSELTNTRFLLYIISDMRPTFLAFVGKVLENTHKQACEVQLYNQNNALAYVYIEGVASEDKTQIYLTVLDITECKKTSEILIASEEKYHSLIESSPDIIIYLDLDKKITFINHTAGGYTQEQVIGVCIYDLLRPEYHHVVREALQKVITTQSVQMYETYDTAPDGKERCYATHAGAIIKQGTEQGKVIGITLTYRDITTQKQAENALIASEEKYRSLIETSSDIIISVDFEGHIQYINHVQPGFEIEDVINKSIYTFISLEYHEIIKKTYQKVIDTQAVQSYESSSFRMNGEKKHYLTNIAPVIHDEKVISFTLIAHDITDRKKEEEHLKLLESVITHANDSILITEAQPFDEIGPKIVYVNASFTRMTGYTSEEVIGKTPRLLQGEKSDKAELQRLSIATRAWQPCEITTINYKKNGKEFWVNFSVTPVANDKGKFTHWISIQRDVTAVKRAEEVKSHLLTLTQNQNKRLQNFAHIVSHNLRSHSSNIEGLLSLITDEHADFTANNNYFQFLEKASKNLMESIGHLSEVVQLQGLKTEKIEAINLYKTIEKAISNTISLAQNANVEVINTLKGDEVVLGAAIYLDSIVLNFLTNSIKYRSKERKSYVKFSCETEGDCLFLQIEDNGLGIDLARDGDKLFGMFKTFHQNNDARGIGLFITKSQIEAMGGKVEVTSKVDKGTTFSVCFKK